MTGNSNGTPSKSANGSSGESPTWLIGLINETGKFLTAETFGFKLNVSGTALKQRQIWTLEPDSATEGVVLIASHLKRYLCTDKDGNVTCDKERGEEGQEGRFQLEYADGSSGKGGRCAFKSVAHGFYLSGSGDRVDCFSKTPVWWALRLSGHPQVHLRNLNRQRYLRLFEDEIRGDQTLPWGYDSLITLEFVKENISIRTRDNRYLSKNGALVETATPECLFNLELKTGALTGLAFRDSDGKYLTLVGSGTMKSKNKAVGKDELFIMEESHAQVGICASNGKYASIKQGVDLYANQSELEEKETFQLEYLSDDKWKIRTCDGKLWTIADSGGIKGSGNDKDPKTVFCLEYQEDGTLALKASNSLYVSSRKLGGVSASGDQVGPEEKFRFVLVNRPIVVFRTSFGFVGTRSGRVECNFVNYETFTLENAPSGHYYLKASNGDYWQVSANGAIELGRGGEPAIFVLQLHSKIRMAIKAPNGMYLRGEQNGQLRADCQEMGSATLFEF